MCLPSSLKLPIIKEYVVSFWCGLVGRVHSRGSTLVPFFLLVFATQPSGMPSISNEIEQDSGGHSQDWTIKPSGSSQPAYGRVGHTDHPSPEVHRGSRSHRSCLLQAPRYRPPCESY